MHFGVDAEFMGTLFDFHTRCVLVCRSNKMKEQYVVHFKMIVHVLRLEVYLAALLILIPALKLCLLTK